MTFVKKSVSRQLLPVLFGAPALVAFVLWFIVPTVIKNGAREDAIMAAENTANQFKVLREYFTQEIVTKALGNGGLTVSFDHKGDPNAIPLPATMMHELSTALAGQGTTIKLYSPYPFPNRANRKLEDFEEAAWAALSANPDQPYVRRDNSNGQDVIRVGIADTMVSEVCVTCHNARADTPKNNWKLGDLRGVLEIASVIDTQIARGERIGHLVSLSLVGFLGLIGLLIYCQFDTRIVKPIKSMTDTMSALVHKDHNVEIPGLDRTDEIGRMAAAIKYFRSESIEKVKLAKEHTVFLEALGDG